MSIRSILKTWAGGKQWATALALALCLAGAAAPTLAQTAALPTEEAEQLYLRALQAMTDNDLDTAQRLLQRLMHDRPDHAGAWLDLAVLYCHMGDGEHANALWREVETRFAPPRPILELIALQRDQGCSRPAAEDGRQSHVQLTRGRSSNVNQGVRDLNVGLTGPAGPLVLQLLPQYAPAADPFTQFNAGLRQALGVAGLEGFVQGQGRWHDTQHRFDVQDVTLGLHQRWAAQDWRGRWQAGAGVTTLGGATYQQHEQLQAWATPPWQPLAPWRWSVAAGASRLRYPTLPAFDAWQWDTRLHLEHATPAGRLEAYAGLSQDQGSHQRPGGNRDGWSLGLDWQHYLGTAWGQPVVARLGLDWLQWKSRELYAPGFIEVQRRQRMTTTAAALVLPLKNDAAWVLEARQVRNNENIGLFAYDAHTVQLSYQKRWGRNSR